MRFASIRHLGWPLSLSLCFLGAVTACGGVYTAGSGSEDGRSSGGASSTGGASAGGSVSPGGKQGAGGLVAHGGFTASGGETGIATGGAVACGPCPQPFCAPEEGMHVAPGGCCSVCGPDCSAVDCAFPICGPGFIAKTSPGSCCPECVPVSVTDPPTPGCDREGYTAFVSQLAQKYAQAPCITKADCTMVAVSACGFTDCGTALPVNYASSIVDAAEGFAANHCSSCGPSAGACPPVVYSAECVGSVCTRVP
jgi:hypothetical protein